MLFWYFLVIVGLIWLIFATVSDIKKREIPDWLNYSLIAIGLGSRLIYSFIMKDFSFILYGLLGFAVFFVFANLMYYTKQWGGGDCKLLMGLGAMFGSYVPVFNFGLYHLAFLVTLIINIFVAGTVYGIIYSLFLGIKNFNKLKIELKKRKFIEIKVSFIIILVLFILSYFIFSGWFFNLVIMLLVLLLFCIILLSLLKVVEDVSLYKIIDVDKLVEGDWLAADVVKNNKIICKVRNIGLIKDDISKLKKSKIKKVLVKEGIPFVPGFLIGFLLSIIFGDVLLLMVTSF